MQEKIYFLSSKENKVCGILSNPASNTNIPIVILCHGFTSSKDRTTYVELEQRLNKQNIATLRFDFFGHGESEGYFADITISEAVDDILKAHEYVQERGFTKFGLMGCSFGGMASIMAASKIKDLSVLALKCPVSNYVEVTMRKRTEEEMTRWESDGFIMHTSGSGKQRRLNYSYFEDFKHHNGYEAAQRITIPTMIVHGDGDEAVPIAQSKKTVGILENGVLETIPRADHKFSNPKDFEKMLELLSEFIVKHV